MKSFASPYGFEVHDGIWLMRDGVAEKRRRIPRKKEVVALSLLAEDVVCRISELDLGHHFVSHIHRLDESQDEIRESYKALGYRSMLSEGMFVHDLLDIPKYTSQPEVRQVVTIEDSEKIKKVRRNRAAIRDSDLTSENPEHRLYAIVDRTRAYGWVGSIPFCDQTWVADLFVRQGYRGRGYGRSLMSAVMAADKAEGINRSVLLASSAGARLYPHLGYRQIGTLQLFCPAKVRSAI